MFHSKRQAFAVLVTLAAASALSPACGGSTEPDGTGGVPSYAVCDGPGQCTVLTTGCCAPCGKPTLADVAGVNEERTDEFRAATCDDPQPICPKCALGPEPNLVAFCESSSCTALDLREHELSSCAKDDDCMLRYPDCCEPCGADPFGLVAIAKAHAADYQAAICRPGEPCPACVPQYPPGYVAGCGTNGHCEVRETACPPNVPTAGDACSSAGVVCEYGLDPRIGCRTHATCDAGEWQLAISGCPPMPGPGEDGCPDTPPDGGVCASDGLICDMGGGTLCACGQCVGGPCSLDPRWACAEPPTTPGCPAAAPELGSTCTSPDLVCVYGVCATTISAGRRCVNGIWTDEPIACPV